MKETKREIFKARVVGNSIGVTIPYRTRQRWDLQAGDPLVIYQLDKALVIVPLSQIPVQGQPEVLATLEAWIQDNRR